MRKSFGTRWRKTMSEKVVFEIKTMMEKEDYRKFLYIATFRRKPIILPMIGLFAFLVAWLQGGLGEHFSMFRILLLWMFLFAIGVGTVCFRVERRNKDRIKTDQTGTFGSETILTFYEDSLKMVTPNVEGTSTLQYHQFYQVLESKDYFIFYFSKNLASLLRKKDMEDIDDFREFIKQKISRRCRKIF